MQAKERKVSKENERKENEQRLGYTGEKKDGQIQEATGPEGVSRASLSVGPNQSP